MYPQYEITKRFNDRQEMIDYYEGRCIFFPYRSLESGQRFRDDWLQKDFTAKIPGLIYQVATKGNTFVEYVFVVDGMVDYPNTKPDSFLFWK